MILISYLLITVYIIQNILQLDWLNQFLLDVNIWRIWWLLFRIRLTRFLRVLSHTFLTRWGASQSLDTNFELWWLLELWSKTIVPFLRLINCWLSACCWIYNRIIQIFALSIYWFFILLLTWLRIYSVFSHFIRNLFIILPINVTSIL